MKEVTVYNLVSKQILVAGDYYETIDCRGYELSPIGYSNEIAVEEPLTKHRVPIRKYQNINWKEPLYICWDRDVQELLDLEIDNTNELRDLQRKNGELKEFKKGVDNMTWKDYLKCAWNKFKEEFK